MTMRGGRADWARRARAAVAAVLVAGAAATAIGAAGPAAATGGTTISGTVVDNHGTPLGGQCVEAQDVQHGHFASTSTGTDGTYTLDLPDAGSYTVAFGCYQTQWVRTYWSASDTQQGADRVQVAAGQAVTGIDGTMVVGGVVTGRVTDGTGAPQANDYVTVGNGQTSFWTTSDVNGVYRVQGIAPGSYQVWTYTSGGQVIWHGTQFTDAEHLLVAAGQTRPGIDLGGPTQAGSSRGSVSGHVYDEAGAPLANECITAVTSADYSTFGFAQTDASGAYSMTGVLPGSYAIEFNSCAEAAHETVYYPNATSKSTATLVSVAGGQDTPNIDGHLGTGSGLSGTVTGPDGQPLQGVCVTAARPEEAGYGWYRNATTDAAGHYRLNAVTPGNWLVYFNVCGVNPDLLSQYYGGAPGDPRDAAATPVAVTADADTTGISMQLVLGGSIDGTVTGNGGPLANVCVFAYPHGDGEPISVNTQTDGNGHYHLSPLPAENADIGFATVCGQAALQDFVPLWYPNGLTQADAAPVSVALGQHVTGIDEDLPIGGKITGTISTPAGSRNSVCAAASRDNTTVPGYGDPVYSNPYAGAGDGTYTLRALPAGTYRVELFDCSGTNRFLPVWYDGATDQASATGVSVSLGQVVTGIDGTLRPNAPEVVGITPTGGAAGDTVSIVGQRVSDATGVSFGGAPATFTHVGPEQLDAVVPAGAAGSTVDVTVAGPGGTSTVVAADQFTYDSRPVVTSVSPDQGPVTSGVGVTITGSRFTGATAVRFGSRDATDVTVVDDSTITASVPAADWPGAVLVSVTTPAGSNDTGPVFTYGGPGTGAAPVVTLVNPDNGPVGGGTVVELKGYNFSGVTAVSFGSNPASWFSFVDDTTLDAMSPAAASPGPVTILVTTSVGGTSGTGPTFTYTPPPTPVVTSVSPDTGPVTGGTSVTISGANFSGATSVAFGDVPAQGFSVLDDNTISAVTPPASAPGQVAVVVGNGTSSSTGGATFTYGEAAPTVWSVSPRSGPTAGGASVSLSGSGFSDADGVFFGGTAATFKVLDDNDIEAVSPAGAAGPVDVTVHNPGGTSALSPDDQYSYVNRPVVTALSPSQGPQAGGTYVTISGSSLWGATAVNFGPTAATWFTVVSDGTIYAQAPAGSGQALVTVVTPGGLSAGSPASTYTYLAPPVVGSVTPAKGKTAGGDPVQITGSHLTGTTAVSFGGSAAASFTVVSDTVINAVTPAHARGVVDVAVTNGGGTGTATGAFRYVGPPVVTSLSPSSGSFLGGTAVSISGTDFVGVSAVDLVDSTGATAVAFTQTAPDGVITFVTPAHLLGTVGVRVTTAYGVSDPTAPAAQYTFGLPRRGGLPPGRQ